MGDEKLRAALAAAQEKLQEQDAYLQRISKDPQRLGVYIGALNEKKCLISSGGGTSIAEDPHILQPGQAVTLHGMSGQIMEALGGTVAVGAMATVYGTRKDGKIELQKEGENVIVWPGAEPVKKGDRVLLDPSGSVIVENLGPADDHYSFTEVTNVSWDDVGGAEDAKAALREAVELPYKQPEIFKRYGKSATKGVLLYGPPGCGKTMLAKATATGMAAVHGHKDGTKGFFYVRGPELLNKFVGETEAGIRRLFEGARAHKASHGYPAVIFIDEADALLASRDGNGFVSAMSRTVVPMFLSEMDGLVDSGAMVLLATNRPDTLDSAVVREGRIDRKVKVTRPGPTETEAIFTLHLDKRPLAKGTSRAELACTGKEELFSEARILYEIDGWQSVRKIGMPHICSGAMIAAIVDQAASAAMMRDLDSGKLTGIGRADVVSAVDSVFRQNRDIDHSEILAEHNPKGGTVRKIAEA